MILKRISVRNFRSIRDITLDVGSQTAIVGGNGAGKSTVLRAIEKFYGSSSIVEADDFFGRQVNDPIEIELTFTSFNDVEKELFNSRIHDDEMTVVRIFEVGGGKSNGRYFGMTPQHPAFAAIRAASGATQQRAEYKSLRDQGGAFAALPNVTKADQIWPALAEFEAKNAGDCELLRDDGQFFGFTNVAKGALQKATSFVFIPAVRDASADALDTRGAVIAKLLELVVKSAIQRRKEIQEFQSKITAEYRELTDPEKLYELGHLSEDLTDTLQVFYREAAVSLSWRSAQDFVVPLPTAEVLLDDDGFQGPVDKKGHGLQRAFILTLLQHLAKATSAEAETALASPRVAETLEASQPETAVHAPESVDKKSPDPYTLPGLILAIEEPELYQHPTKQRHFAKVLTQLSSGELLGVATRTQILFATHSSLFVSMDRFEEVCLARRNPVAGSSHKECSLTSSQLSAVASRMEAAYGKPPGTFTAESLKARLHIINSEIAEGFFADAVVLVEGVSDRAAIIATATIMGVDFEALGVAILPVDGKTNLDRPAAIFKELKIPTYIIWDCDKGDHKDQNNALQMLSGEEATSVKGACKNVTNQYACFENVLEDVLKAEIGAEIYQAELDEAKARYGLTKNDEAIKIPAIMVEVLSAAKEKGAKSATLMTIVDRIVALRRANKAGPGEDIVAEVDAC
ncbi:MAG: ATP-dependent endonuclease [Nitrobacter sp.]|uniref:ATP-dependent nuclease n=1 Tax=Nitrobacter sp. TaxID=29420 RepID=UPI00261FAEF6|nr:AAA family ATPase [Nitrobacter sp.]MCV0387079.1 ATP-dependent endonuclease [Nitrobacter sp.]